MKLFLLLVGICNEDDSLDIDWLTKKIVNMRIFPDEGGVMNKSLLDVKGDVIRSQYLKFSIVMSLIFPIL